MTPQFRATRAAEEFASVIDGPTRDGVADRYVELARTVTLLRERPRPLPRPEFVTDLRERLMRAADEALLPVAPVRTVHTTRPRRSLSWRERHLGAAVAACVLVGSTAGIAAAAQGSLPGEVLYPVKRGMERVEVQMNTNDAARGQELLDQASTRLDEVRALVKEQQGNGALIERTLADFSSTADKGSELLFKTYQGKGNDSDIAAVRDFTSGNMHTLKALAKTSPSEATPAFSHAGEVLADIDQQARVLCVACSDADPVGLPKVLVNLTSARTLEKLVALPTLRLRHAAHLAAAAQQEARTAEAAATEAPSATGDADAGKPTPATPTPTGDPVDTVGKAVGGDDTTGLTKHPVRNLLTGLTSGLENSKLPVASELGKTLEGVTAPLNNTVTGLGNVLGGLLTPRQSSSPDITR